jgi:hypothetical protein
MIEILHRYTKAVLYRSDTTDIVKAAVEQAVMVGANLYGANLRDANLYGANLVGASLVGANNVIDAGSPNNWRTVGWLRNGVLSVRVGCHDKRMAEGRAYWADKPDRREVLAALDYIETA